MTLIKIEFVETTKTVNANVKIESDTMSGDEVMLETKRLMDEAMLYSASKTMRKAI